TAWEAVVLPLNYARALTKHSEELVCGARLRWCGRAHARIRPTARGCVYENALKSVDASPSQNGSWISQSGSDGVSACRPISSAQVVAGGGGAVGISGTSSLNADAVPSTITVITAPK